MRRFQGLMQNSSRVRRDETQIQPPPGQPLLEKRRGAFSSRGGCLY